MKTKIRFGTSGNPPNFFKSKFGKDRMLALDWIDSIGLNAYERMMTYGARMKEEDAIEFGKRAKELDIAISIHAAYYIVLTSEKKEVVKNSINEMKKTIKLAKLMNCKKIVFHPGFGDNVEKLIKNLKIIEKDKPKDIKILPETMGKKSQLGSLDQVLTICEKTDCDPCIDFGHIHAREGGSLKTKEDIRRVLLKIEKRLGKRILKKLHCHYYPIEYTEKGEKVHRAVTEKEFYPKFKPFAELILEYNMCPTLISESKNSQDIGALEMKKIIEKNQKKILK